MVPLRRELSVLAVRGRDGTTACYPLVQNTHREGILRVSLPPPRTAETSSRSPSHMPRASWTRSGHVGVLALELFVDDRAEGPQLLLANEIAPRVHNSRHLTIEGSETSQFATICGRSWAGRSAQRRPGAGARWSA